MPRKSIQPDYEARAVKSAERVLDIFILLASHPNGLKLKDIAQELHIPVSSVFAILNTMKRRGFIERDEYSLVYKPGSRVYQIVPNADSDEDLVSLAIPVMEKVKSACQETVSLSVRVGNEIVFIGKRSSNSLIQVVNALGSRLPAHATGSGKVMLAYLSDCEIDSIYPNEELPRYTANTIATKTDLKRELARIRTLGYAFDDGESGGGVWAVAACIHYRDGSPLAATSIIVPFIRVTEERRAEWCKLITEAAEEISTKLGIKTIQVDTYPRG